MSGLDKIHLFFRHQAGEYIPQERDHQLLDLARQQYDDSRGSVPEIRHESHQVDLGLHHCLAYLKSAQA